MQSVESIPGQNHHFTQVWEHTIICSSSPLSSSPSSRSSSNTGFGFRGLFSFVGKSLGSGLSSSYFQSCTPCFPGQNCVIMPNLDLFPLIIAWISCCSLQLLSFISLVLLFGLGLLLSSFTLNKREGKAQ